MKIKVLNIITGGLLSDGITTSWLTFCRELKSHSEYDFIQLDFASIQNSGDPNIERQFHKIGINTINLPSRLRNPIKYIWTLSKILKSGDYSIVHANGSSNLMVLELFAAWMAGVPLRIAHSRNTISNFKFLHNLFTYPFKWLCNCRLACGVDAGKWLFKNDKFEILHNGKNFDYLNFSVEERHKSRISLGLKDEIVIGHVGKFNEQKNHIFLIKVFSCFVKYCPNSKLLLIGDGPKKNEVISLINQYGLDSKVILTGAVTDVSFKLQSADIMVLPSLYEGLPNVVLEWQAMGLPSIISNSITRECAVTDLVHFMDLAENEDAWAKEILKIHSYNRDRLIDSISGKGELKKNGFDICDNVGQLIRIYRKALDDSMRNKQAL